MDLTPHKPHLYRWKRHEESRVYSRSQKVATTSEIQDWIKKVEDASNHAAEEVFGGTKQSTKQNSGRVQALERRQQLRDHDETLSEAQELLNQWMDEKVQLENELEISDEAWNHSALELEVKREWDNLLENNVADWDRGSSKVKSNDPYGKIYEMDDRDAVNMVLHNLMEKEVIKDSVLKNLGQETIKQKSDPKMKMDLRQKQVKENRERREAELDKRRRDQQTRKEAQFEAKQILVKEEKEKAKKVKHEELEIQKEMAKIRKEMQDEKRRTEEAKGRMRLDKEKVKRLAQEELNKGEEESKREAEQHRRGEEKRREFMKKMEQLQVRQAAVNLKILQRHFSSWYSIVLERHMKMGKAKAIADWRCLLKAWNGWKSHTRTKRVEQETQRYQTDVKETYRKSQTAEKHYRKQMLRKYFQSWQFWVQEEKDRQQLEEAQSQTRNKMKAFLEAAATGKLWQNEEGVQTDRQVERGAGDYTEGRPDSTMRKLDELFETSDRKRTSSLSGLSSARSSVVSKPTGDKTKQKVLNPRIPTEAWQVTRRHLNLTPDEIASLGNETNNLEIESGGKPRKRLGKVPWNIPQMTPTSFENRHKAQQKILEQQQKQLKEQQRLIEELQYNQRNQQLKQQLVHQQQELQKQLNVITEQQIEVKQPTQITNPAASSSNRKNTEIIRNGVTEKPNGEEIQTSKRWATAVESPNSARSAISETTSSTTATKASSCKYVNVLKKMEERAAERLRLKEERDRKRQLEEQEKMLRLQKEEEEVLKRQEEEKRARVEAYREKKRQEKKKEEDRQQQIERFRQLNVLADQHFQKSLLKYRGIRPMKRLVQMAHKKQEDAEHHYTITILRKTFMGWHLYVRDLMKHKHETADEMHKYLIVKKCFNNWKNYKNIMSLLEKKAQRFYKKNLHYRVFMAWADYAAEEKVAGWERERHAREHNVWRMKNKMFHIWRQYPVYRKLEAEREKRKAEMRRKVSSLLPDFVSSSQQSLDQDRASGFSLSKNNVFL